jgi:hypothetical protein
MSINSSTMEKNITKGCPQGSCCGPGFGNLQYNSLLNLRYTNHIKTVAFADDMLIMIIADSITEAAVAAAVVVVVVKISEGFCEGPSLATLRSLLFHCVSLPVHEVKRPSQALC